MLLGWQNLTEDEEEEILLAIAGEGPARGPSHIEMDWTDRCNVDCYFCNNAIRNLAGRELDLEVVDRFLADCRPWGLKSVRLSGGGEPLFHSDLKQLLESLGEHEILIEELNTNGILLTQENCDRLLTVGLQ